MTVEISQNRLNKIHMALNSSKSIEEKKNLAKKEHFLSDIKSFFSSSYRSELSEKQNVIDQIINLTDNTINIIQTATNENLNDSTGNIIKSLYLINNHPLILKSKINIRIVTDNMNDDKIDLQFRKVNGSTYNLKLNLINVNLKSELNKYNSLTHESRWIQNEPSKTNPISFFLNAQHNINGYSEEENIRFDNALINIKVIEERIQFAKYNNKPLLNQNKSINIDVTKNHIKIVNNLKNFNYLNSYRRTDDDDNNYIQ